MKREHAEALAIEVLVWLANDPDRLGHFLNASGAAADDLRTRAQDPEFLGFVLDFLMLDDQSILDFSRDTGQDPEHIAQACMAFIGDRPNWT